MEKYENFHIKIKSENIEIYGYQIYIANKDKISFEKDTTDYAYLKFFFREFNAPSSRDGFEDGRFVSYGISKNENEIFHISSYRKINYVSNSIIQEELLLVLNNYIEKSKNYLLNRTFVLFQETIEKDIQILQTHYDSQMKQLELIQDRIQQKQDFKRELQRYTAE